MLSDETRAAFKRLRSWSEYRRAFRQLRKWKVVLALAVVWTVTLLIKAQLTRSGSGDVMLPVGAGLSVVILNLALASDSE